MNALDARLLADALDQLERQRREHLQRLDRARRLRERDRLLRLLATDLYGDRGPWSRAVALAGLVERYSRRWPRDRSRTRCPFHIVGKAEGAVWEIFMLGVAVPTSARQLYRIIK